MVRVILIDDEEDARFLLRKNIEKKFGKHLIILGEANSVQTGIEAINNYQPDLIFLDIQMSDGNGFDLLDQLPQKNFEVIFVTAYNQYAIKAFQFSALGYLMKPIKSEDFMKTINVILAHFKKFHDASDKRLKVLIENYKDGNMIKKIVIPSSKGFDVIAIEDILFLEGDRNYTNFITKNQPKIASSRTMVEYESLLTEFGFFRIHQSTIVNLRHVKGYMKGDGGFVELTNGKRLPLSRYRKKEFLKRFL